MALAGLAAPAAHAGEPAGSVVVRDPVTGELRAPTAAELRALRPAPTPGTVGTPAQPPKAVTRPDGTRSLTLGDAGMVYSVATRDAESKIRKHCVTGDAAAGAPTTSAPSKEHDHE